MTSTNSLKKIKLIFKNHLPVVKDSCQYQGDAVERPGLQNAFYPNSDSHQRSHQLCHSDHQALTNTGAVSTL